MATEKQYEVFRSVYDEEDQRYEQLDARAKIYFTVISFYLGAIVFKFEDVTKFARASAVPPWLFFVLGAIIAVSLLFCILALQIRSYEGLFDPEEIIEQFGVTPPSDEEFLDQRLIDLAVATNRNSVQNDRVALHLSICAMLLAVAAVLQLVIFTITLSR